jgi:HD-like signal output (HDOD) protein
VGQPVDDLIRWASDLHATSGVANSVLEKTANRNFAVSDVVSLIERDPALTTRILAAVNSSRYGVSRQISNLQQAVALLGQKTLRTIVLSFSVVKALSADIDERIVDRMPA